MIPDPNDEVLATKRRLAAKFDNDLHRIFEDLRSRQADSGHEFITLPPRRCNATTTTNNAVNRSGESGGN